jgi:uncharacterized protein (TIGR02266 family)
VRNPGGQRTKTPVEAETEAERRIRRRFRYEVAITFGSQSHFFEGRTHNLSEGGVFIATAELKPIGTELDLTIELPPPFPSVWTRGEVRWIGEAGNNSNTPLGMGVQFRMISEESLDTIQQFLAMRQGADAT